MYFLHSGYEKPQFCKFQNQINIKMDHSTNIVVSIDTENVLIVPVPTKILFKHPR